MIEDRELEKLLRQFETIEPCGGTDREILEMARRQLRRSRIYRMVYRMRLVAACALLAVLLGMQMLGVEIEETAVYAGTSTGGVLNAIDPRGKPLGTCPLRHTSVSTEISGFVARVTVKQRFHNPFTEKIEAIYTFPLSSNGAVDAMLMKVGERTIEGVIKRRDEARRIYRQAKAAGHVASLLDQERPNIFTQSVANIRPGEQIDITIKYVEMLPYEDGKFTFSFPMVVGPRFNPGGPVSHEGTGWSPDTTEVPDASKISPPVTPPMTRAGHDIDITVKLCAGVPIVDIKSKLHRVEIERVGKSVATVSLENKKTIPNKDFVLEYSVASSKVESGHLVHKKGRHGYLTLVLVPPKKPAPEQIAPKEMIFVIDRSGSQSGLPIGKAKEAMNYILDKMNEDDTFNIISFSSQVETLFAAPRKKSAQMLAEAKRYISTLYGNGGTYMAPAVRKACESPAPENRLRIVTFMTDGYIGNDFHVLGLVKNLRGNSRWFPFGTGNSVNRFLLDNMAKLGGGEVEYILLNSPGEEVARKFYERISTPVLTDIRLQFEGIEVQEVLPGQVHDLWAQKPLYFHARYTRAGKGTVILKGFLGGKPYEQRLQVTLPEVEDTNEVLGSMWARAKVDSLMDQDLISHQTRTPTLETKEEIIKVALEHHIMTQYTSFVAVERRFKTEDGPTKKVAVPVEMPDGVSREGVFGPTGMPPAKARGMGTCGTPAVGLGAGGQMVEKPIIILEEEVEITKDIPHGTSFDRLSNKSLDSTSCVDAYGIGGGRAGAYGQRWGKGSLAREGGSPGTESAVTAALRWLHFHQNKNGQWDQDGFQKNCDKSKGAACDGQGTSHYDVAVTGLSLLAFLGNGQTHRVGMFKKTVKRGLDWLVARQQDDGTFGPRTSESWVYNHAIGTMALCEAYAVTRDYRLKTPAQKALDYIRKAQVKGLGWKYEAGTGRCDTSVTGWMVLALKAAKTAGLSVDKSMFNGAINWFDRATNTAGKCGYMKPGDDGSVIRGVNEHHAKLPTMTAVSVLCRILSGQKRQDAKVLKGVDILMSSLPNWNKPKNDKVDMYYWYYATYAMFQYGGQNWHKWNTAMKKALLDTQRMGGCADGSWDPVGKWGAVGGRVYATAIGALTLEIYYRYARANRGKHTPRDSKMGK